MCSAMPLFLPPRGSSMRVKLKLNTLFVATALNMLALSSNAAAAGEGFLDTPLGEQLPEMLAKLTMAKEGNVKSAAQSAMTIFGAVAREHLKEVYGSQNPKASFQVLPGRGGFSFSPQSLSPSVAPSGNSSTPVNGSSSTMTGSLAEQVASNVMALLHNISISSLDITGPDFLDYAPCLVSAQPRGIAVTASALQIIPQLINVSPAGVAIVPYGVSIQPTLAFIQPVGTEIAPTGIFIFPSLIAVTPILDSNTPIGIQQASSILQVRGRKLLAPPQQDIAERFNTSYGKWVSLVSDLAMSEGKSMEGALGMLNNTFSRAHEVLQSQEVPTHPSVNILPPSISGPMWVRNLASTVSASLGLVSVSTSFINFSPCVAAINPAGVAVDAAAVNIEPTGIYVLPFGFEAKPEGILIIPTLINLEPELQLVAPIGIAITPSLLQVVPSLHVVSPVGRQDSHVAFVAAPDGTIVASDASGIPPGEESSNTSGIPPGQGPLDAVSIPP